MNCGIVRWCARIGIVIWTMKTTMCGAIIAFGDWQKRLSNRICCRRCPRTRQNCGHSITRGIRTIVHEMCISNRMDSRCIGEPSLRFIISIVTTIWHCFSLSLLCVCRNPVAQSTDATRSKIGFRQGRHAWEVIWEGPLGTVAVIGISTKDASLQCHGYVALLGSDDQSWGWNLVDNHLLHNGDAQGNYPLLNNAPKYQVGERIRVILDCDDNTLSFEKNYEFLGVAFRGEWRISSWQTLATRIFNCLIYSQFTGLPDKRLYPTVSAVYGNTEVSMIYLGPPVDGWVDALRFVTLS